MKTNYVYVTKSVREDMTAYKDFKYPEKGVVEAPDWDATNECGKGLHGFLWGEGNGSLAHYTSDYKWLLIRVNPVEDLVVMEDKCKFRKGYVISVGDYKSIAKKLTKYLPNDRVYKVIGLTMETGYKGVSMVGDYGISISGDRGTSISGAWGTSTSGIGGTSTSGYNGQSKSGDVGQSKSGEHGTSTSDESGYSISGRCGHSTSGVNGKSISSYYGQSTSGRHGYAISEDEGSSSSGTYGTSITGFGGTAQSGEGGVLMISYWFGGEYCRKVGHIGKDGLKPDTKYKLDNNNDFIEVVKKKEENE